MRYGKSKDKYYSSPILLEESKIVFLKSSFMCDEFEFDNDNKSIYLLIKFDSEEDKHEFIKRYKKT